MSLDSPFKHVSTCFSQLVAEDRHFIWLALVYGVAISLLTLAVPVSVQLLVNSVAHTASHQAVVTLAIILFVLLFFSGVFHALQTYLLELFERRIFARLSAEFTLRLINVQQQAVESLNRHELVNRFFDIMSVQKIIPHLVIGLFALMLQSAVGIVLVSFYHPWFLIFNLCFVLMIWGVWKLWGSRAVNAALATSQAKYDTARHLEEIARANSFFKSSQHADFAAQKTELCVAHYMAHKRRYFKFSFMQHVAFLLLYAVSSASLLGIGGWLVIRGELTLGQLVAAELILSAVFYGVSRLGYHLMQFYELSAGLEEVYRLFVLPLEHGSGKKLLPEGAASLQFVKARFEFDRQPAMFDVTIGAGAKILAHSGSYQVQYYWMQAIKAFMPASKGRVLVSGLDMRTLNSKRLRDEVIVLDLPTAIECTIGEYLMMAGADVSLPDIHAMLTLVELDGVMDSLPDGLDTMLHISGLPLSPSETIRLKLAAALLAKPKLLVLSEMFDTLSYERRKRIMARLCGLEDMTLIYFTNRQDLEMFDAYLFLNNETHKWCDTVKELRECEHGGTC